MNRVDSSAATVAMVAQPAMARWRLVLSVFKLRIGTLIMLTAIAGLAVVPGGGATPWQSLVLALSVLVASASAGAFNQYVEADSDRLMARTRSRASAAGRPCARGAKARVSAMVRRGLKLPNGSWNTRLMSRRSVRGRSVP